MARHLDPYRDVDAQPDPARFIESLEARGRMPSQQRLRRRFLRFVPVRPGDAVLEVGCGTGVVLRDLAALVGPRGRVVGVEPSRQLVRAARRICGAHRLGRRIALRQAAGERLPFPAGRFDAAIAVTVLLHVPRPLAVLAEMARVVRPGGAIGIQDQDFGTVAAAHPDQELTDHIMRGVSHRMYDEPYSGRRLAGLLRQAGLARVRLLTDVYQDTTLQDYTRTFLERRAELAVRFDLASPRRVQQWLDGFEALARDGSFVLTMNFYGAVGLRPPASGRPRSAR